MKIINFEMGDMVIGDNQPLLVSECIHGKKYYSLVNDQTVDDAEWNSLPTVCDWDEDYIAECCG